MDKRKEAYLMHLKELEAATKAECSLDMFDDQEFDTPEVAELKENLVSYQQILETVMYLFKKTMTYDNTVDELNIPQEYKIDSNELFNILLKTPKERQLEALKHLDCDNAAILNDLIEAVKSENIDLFNHILKKNNINTSKVSKLASLFNDICMFDDEPFEGDIEDTDIEVVTDLMLDSSAKAVKIMYDNGDDELHQFSDIISKWIYQPYLSNYDSSLNIKDFFTKIWDQGLSQNKNLVDLLLRKNYAEAEQQLIKCTEPLLKMLVVLLYISIDKTEAKIIQKAIDRWGVNEWCLHLIADMNKFYEEELRKRSSEAAVETEFTIPDDFFTSGDYKIGPEESHFTIASDFGDSCRRKDIKIQDAVLQLINFLARNEFIGNSNQEKAKFLYLITGRLIDKDAEAPTAKFDWLGEAMVAYHLLKNMCAKKDRYTKIPQLINFTCDTEGAKELENKYKEEKKSISAYVDLVKNTNYRNYVSEQFGWTFKGSKATPKG